MSEQETDKPKRGLSIWQILTQASLLTGHFFCFITCFVLFLFVAPKVQAEYTEMLAGEPLPALTIWVFNFRIIPLAVSMLLIGIAVAILVLAVRYPKLAALLNVLLLLAHCTMIGLGIIGLYMPHVKMMERLG